MLLVRFIYVLLTLVLAVCVPHFDLLMGLTGSLTGALLSFIFPCIFHIYIKRLNLLYHEGPFTKKIYFGMRNFARLRKFPSNLTFENLQETNWVFVLILKDSSGMKLRGYEPSLVSLYEVL